MTMSERESKRPTKLGARFLEILQAFAEAEQRRSMGRINALPVGSRRPRSTSSLAPDGTRSRG